jgi:hypothetical protein
VQATIFASRIGSGSPAGYAIPAEVVRESLAEAGTREVSTGPCVR